MDLTISPGNLGGELQIIPSKSQAHRLLICAAFADAPTELICPETNRDIEATAACLSALGAAVRRTPTGYSVTPCACIPESACLRCGESGSTLRFLLPIVGALGVSAVFQLEGRLPQRPLSPLWEEMERMGCQLQFISDHELLCQGQLRSGDYTINGSVSSQFITGLLFAAALMKGDSVIHITGTLESKPYVDMTLQAMAQFGICVTNLHVSGGRQFHSPGQLTVEGDWSNGAFWLAAEALGNPIRVSGLAADSAQGDRAVTEILHQLETGCPTICARDIPDLVPILAVAAGAKHGAVFTQIERLRLKESDRVAATVAMLRNLGGKAEATADTLTVYGTGYAGGTVDACNDHRIAMATAIAATVCTQPVTILGADCVQKSYPSFWAEYKRLGGQYEQHLR